MLGTSALSPTARRPILVLTSAATLLAASYVVWGPANPSSALGSGGASRTWVSGTGDDNNPCSRTAPCKTFVGALTKTVAGGEISVLDPGGYGAVTINKAITIDGGGPRGDALVVSTNGITVAAGVGDDVVLRRLDLFGGSQCGNPSGTLAGISGVRYVSGRNLLIEDSTIASFGEVGIKAEASSTNLRLAVNRTSVHGNCVSGIEASSTGTGRVTMAIADSSSSFNGIGVRVLNGKTTISSSHLMTNESKGVMAQTSFVTVSDTTISGSNVGVTTETGGLARLAGSTISNNGIGLQVVGGRIESFGDNVASGNNSDGAVPTPKAKF